MKMFFRYENSNKEIYGDRIVVFHGTIDNQIKLYDAICNGLHGNSKDFLLDNQYVSKKELNIIEFSNNSILDDLKLTSKSYNLKILESILCEIDDDYVQTMNECLGKLKMKVMDTYSSLSNVYEQVVPDISFSDIKKIVTDNFSLVNKEEVNISLQIELQIMIILNYIKQNPNKIFYVLIKHFNHCLDSSQMNFILNQYLHEYNIRLVVFLKSFEIFEDLDYLNCNFMINSEEVFRLKVNYDFQDLDLYTMEENQVRIKVLNLKKRYKKYSEIVNEKKSK